MTRHRICRPLLILLLLIALPAGAGAWGLRRPARNVIVMISDGMGFQHREAASLYAVGRQDSPVYAAFPQRLAMSTYALDGGYDPAQAWRAFAGVREGATDSAAAATAMASGHKTRRGAIGMVPDDAGGLRPVENLVERAEALGKATGLVTSVPFAHATPAAFAVHDDSRKNGATIANRLLRDSALEVLMGCGHPLFDKDGRRLNAARSFKSVGIAAETWAALQAGTLGGDADGDGQADPWTLIEERRDFQRLAVGDAPKRLLGIARVERTLQQERGGDTLARPYAAPQLATVPTLTEMTRAALNVLDDDPDGFFLLVEGGAVDWASHANQAGRMLEEQLDFDRSVAAVVHWVETRSNWGETLLIVTGDHETGQLSGPGSDPGWQPLVSRGRNRPPAMEWHSDEHTNSLVPLFARGHSAALLSKRVKGKDPRRGRYVDNTAVAEVAFAALNGDLRGTVQGWIDSIWSLMPGEEEKEGAQRE